MAKLTDPADELAIINSRLTTSSSAAGVEFLAKEFDVEPSSTEFYTILAVILERCDHVGSILKRCDWEPDKKISAVREIKGFKKAFRLQSLSSPWNNGSFSGLKLVREHGKVIQFWSPEVRKVESYPSLGPEEILDLRHLISDYLDALKENDELEPFVRYAIIDGLTKLDFSLKYFSWLGAGYNIDAFRNVVEQYRMLNQNESATSENGNLKAAMTGLLHIIKAAKEKYDTVESWGNTATSAYEKYKLASAFLTPLLLAYHPS